MGPSLFHPKQTENNINNRLIKLNNFFLVHFATRFVVKLTREFKFESRDTSRPARTSPLLTPNLSARTEKNVRWRMTHFSFYSVSSALLLLLDGILSENEIECRVSWEKHTQLKFGISFLSSSPIAPYIVAVVYLIDSRANNVTNSFIMPWWAVTVGHSSYLKNFIAVAGRLCNRSQWAYLGRNFRENFREGESDNGEVFLKRVRDVNDVIENSKFCGESCDRPQAEPSRACGNEAPKSTQN